MDNVNDFDLECINEIVSWFENKDLNASELFNLQSKAYEYSKFNSTMSQKGKVIMKELRNGITLALRAKSWWQSDVSIMKRVIEAEDHYDKMIEIDDAISKALEEGWYKNLNELIPEINDPKNKKVLHLLEAIMPWIWQQIEAINNLTLPS